MIKEAYDRGFQNEMEKIGADLRGDWTHRRGFASKIRGQIKNEIGKYANDIDTPLTNNLKKLFTPKPNMSTGIGGGAAMAKPVV